MPLSSSARPFVAASVFVLLTSSLSAQTIRGAVFDSASASPVAAATIELVSPDSLRVARERSDERGEFRMRAPAPGSYLLRVQRIGYRTFERVLVVERGRDTSLTLVATAMPVSLPGFGVTSE